MGNSVTAPFISDAQKSILQQHVPFKEKSNSAHHKSATKQSSDNAEGCWRESIEQNSVVRVWDTVMQTSYPAVVTQASDNQVSLRFCPKYPDGSYCGCVVDQKTTRSANIINPYLSEKKTPKKESLLNAQCRTESLDHLSEMIWGDTKENAAIDANMVLTRGRKTAPPPPPPAIKKMVAHMPKQRLDSIDEYD